MYLKATAIYNDPQLIRHDDPELWRSLRRFNLPVQLAVAAAVAVAEQAQDAARAALISLAPCRSGSPELLNWAEKIAGRYGSGDAGGFRMNPVHTLHAVDNLALSALSIHLGNHAYALGLGGAAGQCWSALEAARDCLADGLAEEVIVLAGDQEISDSGSKGLAVAMLLATGAAGQPDWRLSDIRREPQRRRGDQEPHAARGLSAMIENLRQQPAGEWQYQISPSDGNGIDNYTLTWTKA